MRFVISGVPYAVEALDVLTSSDPDDVSTCDTRRHVIELLRGPSLESATLALSREVCQAWLASHETPRTAAAFGEVAEGLLVAFHDEFTRQGGRPALAALLGVPYEGNEGALATADWRGMPSEERRRFVIRHTVCAQLSEAQFEVFMARCDAAGLDPLRGDCWPAVAYDADRRVLRVEARTTIKAIRRIGQASEHFAGVTTPEFSADGAAWSEVWTDRDNPPYAARCGVYRRGVERPIYAVCLWDNFAQFRERTDGTLVPTEHWRVRGPWMLGKCAEAAAYARAIPECDGIYLAETAEGGRPAGRHARALGRRAGAGPNAMGGFGVVGSAGELRLMAGSGGMMTLDDDVGRTRGGGGESRWAEVMRRAAPGSTADQRTALLEEFRGRGAGGFEDENPEAFERALADEARKRFSRRR